MIYNEFLLSTIHQKCSRCINYRIDDDIDEIEVTDHRDVRKKQTIRLLEAIGIDPYTPFDQKKQGVEDLDHGVLIKKVADQTIDSKAKVGKTFYLCIFSIKFQLILYLARMKQYEESKSESDSDEDRDITNQDLQNDYEGVDIRTDDVTQKTSNQLDHKTTDESGSTVPPISDDKAEIDPMRMALIVVDGDKKKQQNSVLNQSKIELYPVDHLELTDFALPKIKKPRNTSNNHSRNESAGSLEPNPLKLKTNEFSVFETKKSSGVKSTNLKITVKNKKSMVIFKDV